MSRSDKTEYQTERSIVSTAHNVQIVGLRRCGEEVAVALRKSLQEEICEAQDWVKLTSCMMSELEVTKCMMRVLIKLEEVVVLVEPIIGS